MIKEHDYNIIYRSRSALELIISKDDFVKKKKNTRKEGVKISNSFLVPSQTTRRGMEWSRDGAALASPLLVFG
jgi:hypothetical protein